MKVNRRFVLVERVSRIRRPAWGQAGGVRWVGVTSREESRCLLG